VEVDDAATQARNERIAKRNLFQELIELRDKQREERQDAVWLVKGNSLPWEQNDLGKMRWYLHPTLEDTVIHSLMLWVQEIPPGSQTGKLQFQGGQVIYVWAGRGHTLLDGVRHSWEAGDVINLPLRTEGITVQHFNEDPNEPARLICSEANYAHALGVDRGAGFEILERAPREG
jgi:gentisate 1,2-dioxygenase